MVSVTATLPLRSLPPALLLWLLLSLSDLLRVCECRLLFDLLASEVTSTCSKLAQLTQACSRSHPPAPPSLPLPPLPLDLGQSATRHSMHVVRGTDKLSLYVQLHHTRYTTV